MVCGRVFDSHPVLGYLFSLFQYSPSLLLTVKTSLVCGVEKYSYQVVFPCDIAQVFDCMGTPLPEETYLSNNVIIHWKPGPGSSKRIFIDSPFSGPLPTFSLIPFQRMSGDPFFKPLGPFPKIAVAHYTLDNTPPLGR